MITFGPRETLQILDGSKDFAIVKRLDSNNERIAFAAPALAFVADAIANAHGAERIRFNNRLDHVFRLSKSSSQPGFGVPSPQYTILDFGRPDVRMFPKIREAVGGEVGVLMLQTLAIAATNGVAVWLEASSQNIAIQERLRAAEIHVGIEIVG